jgi:L-threonylcarbamoyladenylate synthase
VQPLAVRLLEEGQTVGIMARQPLQLRHARARVRIIPGDLARYARELFAVLRELDAQGCQVIVAEGVAEEGLGRAVMDRLRRAAQGSQGRD